MVSLTTDAQGGLPGEKTVLGSGTLNATTVDFKDDVVLAANTTVTGTTVSFEKTINSDAPATPRALTVIPAGPRPSAARSATRRLVSLTTDAQGGLPGEKTVLGGGTFNATTVDFKDDVVLAANTRPVSGTTVSFEKTINSDAPATPRALTVDAGGATAFGGAIGNTAALVSLTTDAQGGLPGEKTVLGGGTVNATTVDFKDDVVLAANTTVSGTTVSFEKTINSDAPATPRC